MIWNNLVSIKGLNYFCLQESKDSGDGKQNTADMTQFVSFLDSIVTFLQG